VHRLSSGEGRGFVYHDEQDSFLDCGASNQASVPVCIKQEDARWSQSWRWTTVRGFTAARAKTVKPKVSEGRGRGEHSAYL
jgi:hypothetical protein